MISRSGFHQIRLLHIIETAGVVSLMLLGVSATGGGLFLIFDPAGVSFGFPPELLSRTPFADYLLPGLILFGVLGLGSLLATVFWFIRPSFRGYDLLFEGCALVIWISVQVYYIGLIDLLQPLMFLFGLMMCGLATWIIRLRDTDQ